MWWRTVAGLMQRSSAMWAVLSPFPRAPAPPAVGRKGGPGVGAMRLAGGRGALPVGDRHSKRWTILFAPLHDQRGHRTGVVSAAALRREHLGSVDRLTALRHFDHGATLAAVPMSSDPGPASPPAATADDLGAPIAETILCSFVPGDDPRPGIDCEGRCFPVVATTRSVHEPSFRTPVAFRRPHAERRPSCLAAARRPWVHGQTLRRTRPWLARGLRRLLSVEAGQDQQRQRRQSNTLGEQRPAVEVARRSRSITNAGWRLDHDAEHRRRRPFHLAQSDQPCDTIAPFLSRHQAVPRRLVVARAMHEDVICALR